MTYEERDAACKTFHTVTAPAVLSALNTIDPGWTVEPQDSASDSWRFVMVNSAGSVAAERVLLSFDRYKGRINVSGLYGQTPKGGYWTPRSHTRDARSEDISVSRDRSPLSIARDIARRFLPVYREYLTWYRQDCQQMEKHQIDTRELFDLLVATSGDRLPRRPHDMRDPDSLSTSVYDLNGVSYGTIRVSGDHVRIELSCNAAFALRFAALLKG